jgi:hypothetical protein
MTKEPARPKSLSRFFAPRRRLFPKGLLAFSIAMMVTFVSTSSLWTPFLGGAFYRVVLILSGYQVLASAGLFYMCSGPRLSAA